MIKGKVAFVTGAASGIGLAISEMLIEENSKVVMVDINEELLKEQAERLGAEYFVADLSKEEDNRKAIDYAAEKYKSVDILVNVAGIQTVAPIKEFPEEKWNFMMNLMLTSPMLLTKYAWPYMEKNKWGRIINLNSIHGLVASPYKSAYVTAKHGLSGLTKTAALEGGEYGITVNSISPSYVRTPLVDKQIADQAKTHGISEENVITEIMLEKAAIKELLEPAQVASFVKYLCSDDASSITGAVLAMDGGWTAG